MSYRTRTQKFLIVSRQCPVSGELGLAFDKTPDTDDISSATNGLLLAHDVIEHVNGLSEIGSVEDELQALACVWYIRAQYNCDIKLEYDLISLIRYIDFEDIREQKLNSRYHEDDATFLSIINKNKKEDYESELGETMTEEGYELWNKYCLHWFRIGARKAAKKYPCFIQASHMFMEVEREVNNILRDMEYEGQEWQITLDWKEESCSSREIVRQFY